MLESHELVYETYGQLNSAGDNAVLICHALSGSHHAAGFPPLTIAVRAGGIWRLARGNQSTPTVCLWSAQITSAVAMAHQAPTPSTPLPTNHGVVNFLSLKSVTGFGAKTTGRVSWHQSVGCGHGRQPRWHAGAAVGRGFSRLGGALRRVGGGAGLTAQNIAFNEIARHAILSDPDWSEGDYLGKGKLPTRGVALARMATSYMSADGMSDRFGESYEKEALHRAITMSGCFRLKATRH